MKEIIYQCVNFGGIGIALGGTFSFIVIIIDYVVTSVLSMMKAR